MNAKDELSVAPSTSKAASEKLQATNTSTTQKHSNPFYISPTLFQNKRLKRKRIKWAKDLNIYGLTKVSKTEQRNSKRNLQNDFKKLEANITIDLLSDDDADNMDKKMKQEQQQPQQYQYTKTMNNGEQNFNYHNQQHQNHHHHHPDQIEICKVPNITLIPVQKSNQILSIQQHQQLLLLQQQQQLLLQQQLEKQQHLQLQKQQQINNNNNQRKRKSRKPKRLPQPTIVNNESIVLSDDSDVELNDLKLDSSVHHITSSEQNYIDSVSVEFCKDLKSTKNFESSTELLHLQQQQQQEQHSQNKTLHQQYQQQKSPQSQSPTQTPQQQPQQQPQQIVIPRIEQVDDEVTVSLVPRSSTAGTCPKPSSDELFPMLPDETTVHTVIANRIYELSLTSLREGLACSGMTEYSSEPQKILTQKRKNNGIIPTTNSVPTPQQQQQQQVQQQQQQKQIHQQQQQQQQQQTPVSLKLSSDLSISLISDEEEEEEKMANRQEIIKATNIVTKNTTHNNSRQLSSYKQNQHQHQKPQT